VRRFLLVLTVVMLITTMLATSAPSVTAQEGGSQASCTRQWFREWHQWWDVGPSGYPVGWWYFWWYKVCFVPDVGWFRLYDSWEWDGLVLLQ
jgi:hypothetical protein